MAKQLQLRGGTTTEHSTFTGAEREVTVDTDKDTLVVHDGSTAGGFPLVKDIASNYPTIKPSLNLDFVNQKTLDPRVTFTRTTTGTYYDGKTAVKAEENLLTYSQDFDNWSKNRMTITANSTTAPDGTMTADLIIPDTTSSSYHCISKSVSTSGVSTYSVYAKANGYNYLYMTTEQIVLSATNKVIFNLSTGTIHSESGTLTGTIIDIGSGWYRCIVNSTSAISSSVSLLPSGNNSSYSFSGDGSSGIYIWGAQLEQRDEVTAYTPTTSQPVTNYIPVMQTASVDEPRFDYDPATGEAKGLLIEEQRTNLITYSEEFSDVSWDKSNITIDSNVIVSPNGDTSGYSLITSTGELLSVQSVGLRRYVTGNATYTLSCYAKKGLANYLRLGGDNGGGYVLGAVYNLDTGTYLGTSKHPVFTNVSGGIVDVGNGWYRCYISYDNPASATSIRIQCSTTQPSGYMYTTVSGDGTSGIYIWGAQLEAGSFPTSYIPTSGSQVTRTADNASMTGDNFSSWYRQDEGTIMTEFETDHSNVGTGDVITPFELYSSGSNRIILGSSTSHDPMNADVWYNGTNYRIFTGYIVPNIYTKFAFGWKTGDSAVSKDGGSIKTQTPFGIPEVSVMSIGKLYAATSGTLHIKKLAYYPSRLSNTELQALTEN